MADQRLTTAHRTRWILTCTILAGLALLVGAGYKAHAEPARHEFWSVAVPGLLTGFGTLGLALSTVMLSVSERRRDDYLRTEQRRELTNQAAAVYDAEGLREARKVMTNITPQYDWGIDGVEPSHDLIQIINASSEPILDVKVIGGGWPEALRALNPPEVSSTSWQPGSGEGGRPFVMSGETKTLNGTWVAPETLEGFTMGVPINRILSNAERGSLDVSIAWTDSSGRYWRRDGRALPVRLGQAWNWQDGSKESGY